MRTVEPKYNQIIKITSEKLEIPKIQPVEGVEQKILFAAISNFKIPTHVFDRISECFKDKNYYLEYYYLDKIGVKRGNLGQIRNFLCNNLVFSSTNQFLKAWSEHYFDFAMGILLFHGNLNFRNSLFDNFIKCSIISNDWEQEVEQHVRKSF
jgi:hypothetical protein